MSIDVNSNEVQLAMKEIVRAEKRGQGYFDQIGAAMSALMRKGFYLRSFTTSCGSSLQFEELK